MTAPTLEGTWSGSVNLPLQDVSTIGWICRSIFVSLKTQLTGEAHGTEFHSGGGTRAALWTVEQSCDGSSVSSSDLWGTSVYPELLANFAGSAHAWIVLKYVGADHTLRLCLDLNNGWYPYQYGILASLDAPFTGGTTTQRPVASNEICGHVVGAPSVTSVSDFVAGGVPTGGTYYSHLAIDEDNGGFHFAVSRAGSGRACTYLGVFLLEDADASDAYPLQIGLASGNASLDTVPILMRTTGYSSLCREGGLNTRLWDGTTYLQYGGLSRPAYGMADISSASIFADKLDDVTGELWAWRLDVVSTDGTTVMHRGRVKDVYGVNSLGFGHHVSEKWYTVGNLALPFQAAPTA